MLARQAQEGMRDAAAKVALLEARVAEVAVQRSQLEDLIQSLSRSRDENLLVDIEAAIRVARAAARHHRQRRAAGGRRSSRATSAWRATASRAWKACGARSRATSTACKRVGVADVADA